MPQNANQAGIDAYLEGLLTQRKVSQHTLSAYRRDLGDLSALADSGSFIDITHFQIRQFAAKLHAKGLSPRSIARKLSAWRSFFSWLAQQTPMASNPAEGIKPPKRTRPLPKSLSEEDAIRMVSAEVQAPDVVTHACNRAMFELLYSSGLRVSELAALDVRFVQRADHVSSSWLDFESHEVIVTGKGNKQIGRAHV